MCLLYQIVKKNKTVRDVSLTSTPVIDIRFFLIKKAPVFYRSFLFLTGDNRSRLKLQNLLFYNFRPVRYTAAGIRAGFSSHLVGVSLTSTPVLYTYVLK